MFQLKIFPLRVTFRFVRAEAIGRAMCCIAKGCPMNRAAATSVVLEVSFPTTQTFNINWAAFDSMQFGFVFLVTWVLFSHRTQIKISFPPKLRFYLQ